MVWTDFPAGIFAAIFAATADRLFPKPDRLGGFCGIMMGGIMAFLWFNIPFTRFYMGETGILNRTTALTGVSDRYCGGLADYRFFRFSPLPVLLFCRYFPKIFGAKKSSEYASSIITSKLRAYRTAKW